MRTIRHITVLCFALITLPSPGKETSGEKILRCDELAHFSSTMAINRDAGGTLSRVKELLDEDTNFSASEKKSMYRIALKSYVYGAMSPEYIKKYVVTTCVMDRK